VSNNSFGFSDFLGMQRLPLSFKHPLSYHSRFKRSSPKAGRLHHVKSKAGDLLTLNHKKWAMTGGCERKWWERIERY
jgi:hypothetical protein